MMTAFVKIGLMHVPSEVLVTMLMWSLVSTAVLVLMIQQLQYRAHRTVMQFLNRGS